MVPPSEALRATQEIDVGRRCHFEKRCRMGIIHDVKAEYLDPAGVQTPVSIYATDHAERLTCRSCGKQYVSRGKTDPGICRNCEAKENAMLIGGPLDGEKAYE